MKLSVEVRFDFGHKEERQVEEKEKNTFRGENEKEDKKRRGSGSVNKKIPDLRSSRSTSAVSPEMSF